MSSMTATLWITLIGMGLVFIAILLLWGLMDVMMRISARFAGAEKHDSAGEMDEEIAVEEPSFFSTAGGQKKRAAAAAVAVALALRLRARHAAPPQSTGSAWQAVHRTRQLNQSTHITRKS